MLCVSPSPLHPILPAPIVPVVLVLVVGLTTGYLGTLAMIMAPASALQEQKELTGGDGRGFPNVARGSTVSALLVLLGSKLTNVQKFIR